jgi:hypothetical protein
MLCSVSALVRVRPIFRIIDYVMDSVPMAIIMFIPFVWYFEQMSLDADPERSPPLAHSYSNVQSFGFDSRILPSQVF